MDNNEQVYSTISSDFFNEIEQSSIESLSTLEKQIESENLEKVNNFTHIKSKIDLQALHNLLNNLKLLCSDDHISEWIKSMENNLVLSNTSAVSIKLIRIKTNENVLSM
jgi:hypothetical protein